jgi:hypothetical protein
MNPSSRGSTRRSVHTSATTRPPAPGAADPVDRDAPSGGGVTEVRHGVCARPQYRVATHGSFPSRRPLCDRRGSWADCLRLRVMSGETLGNRRHGPFPPGKPTSAPHASPRPRLPRSALTTPAVRTGRRRLRRPVTASEEWWRIQVVPIRRLPGRFRLAPSRWVCSPSHLKRAPSVEIVSSTPGSGVVSDSARRRPCLGRSRRLDPTRW